MPDSGPKSESFRDSFGEGFSVQHGGADIDDAQLEKREWAASRREHIALPARQGGTRSTIALDDIALDDQERPPGFHPEGRFTTL